MRILLVKMSSMGDIIHNMPMIHDIKTHFPNAQIDWVVEEAFVDLARLNPLVNNVIPIALRRWKKSIFSKKNWAEFFAFKKQLQAQTYDYILDTQGLIKSALIAKLAHGNSYGQNAQTSHEYPAHWFLNRTFNIPKNLHAITRNRMLAGLSLDYAVNDAQINYDIALTKFEENVINLLPPNCIMLVHSTAREAKHWPNENWVKLGQFLNAQAYALALPWGNDIEKERAETIASQLKNAIVLPKLSIVQLTYLLAKTKACIGLDTGLTHIATAINRPTLAIFTDTHIWQAGTMPAATGCAVTIGGKPAQPTVEAVIDAFKTLMTQHV
jgi:heptosyltransferase I